MDLGQIFKIQQKEMCGLDIGSSAVKIVTLRKNGSEYKIIAAGISHIPANTHGNLSGQHQNDEDVTKVIHDCLVMTKLRSKKRINTKLAVCGVSGPEVAVRDFSFPPLPDEEVESAVSLEAELVCPFSAGQTTVDYQLIPHSEERTKGIFVAATKMVITNKTQLAKAAGLKCVMVDVDGLALLNCFNNLASDQQKSGAAVLNVGGSYTTLAILNKDGWPFIRDTVCAGDNIIRQIAMAKDTTPEQLKMTLFGDSQENQIEIGSSLEIASEKLITGVSEALRFYSTQEKSLPINKIFVCGGFASARGFVEILSRRLGVEVFLWNPFDSVHCNIPKKYENLCKKMGPAMAVATGLAMRSLDNTDMGHHE